MPDELAYCIVDTGPLINFALGGALPVLTAATEQYKFKIIDVVEMEATLPGKPGAKLIENWIAEQKKRGALEIIETEIGVQINEGRKNDAHFRIKHAGEHAICEWLEAGGANDADRTVVVYEDKGLLNNLKRIFLEANIDAATPRAFLELGQRQGFVEDAEAVWAKMAEASPTRLPLSTLTPISQKPNRGGMTP